MGAGQDLGLLIGGMLGRGGVQRGGHAWARENAGLFVGDGLGEELGFGGLGFGFWKKTRECSSLDSTYIDVRVERGVNVLA